jgi:hypothetical protein
MEGARLIVEVAKRNGELDKLVATINSTCVQEEREPIPEPWQASGVTFYEIDLNASCVDFDVSLR